MPDPHRADGRPTPAPDAAVIIPHYEDVGRLTRCLDALQRDQPGRRIEVVVADNGTQTDLTAVQARHPDVRLHSNSEQAPRDQRVISGESVSVGALIVDARLTPGHASDGVTYVIGGWPGGAPMAAVVGDAIFAGSMGKDFNTPQSAQQKIREEILSLPLDTLVCPGHGPLTTIAEEKENNPFFP